MLYDFWDSKLKDLVVVGDGGVSATLSQLSCAFKKYIYTYIYLKKNIYKKKERRLITLLVTIVCPPPLLTWSGGFFYCVDISAPSSVTLFWAPRWLSPPGYRWSTPVAAA